jgi:hypothetical protein
MVPNTFPFYDPGYPRLPYRKSQCRGRACSPLPLPSFGSMLYIYEFSIAVYIEESMLYYNTRSALCESIVLINCSINPLVKLNKFIQNQ